ncbi:Short stature homeobox protein 2 [Coemansia sp. Benny D160-2]|nr:Short stature homeobox protein 2 [Coemansia sp. Benny D160-2]
MFITSSFLADDKSSTLSDIDTSAFFLLSPDTKPSAIVDPAMNLNTVMPANTHIAPISSDPISAVHITRSVSTAELVSTVSHAGQNASGNVLATPIASESLSVTAATTTAATKEDSSMQSSKASSKTGNRKRARATSEQVTVLESVFMVNRSPASRVREDLAARLGMAPRQVQVWFQNRRAKEKTQQRNPRGLQHHPSILLDQLAYANGPQDFYSMAMASTIGGGPGGFPGNSARLCILITALLVPQALLLL